MKRAPATLRKPALVQRLRRQALRLAARPGQAASPRSARGHRRPKVHTGRRRKEQLGLHGTSTVPFGGWLLARSRLPVRPRQEEGGAGVDGIASGLWLRSLSDISEWSALEIATVVPSPHAKNSRTTSASGRTEDVLPPAANMLRTPPDKCSLGPCGSSESQPTWWRPSIDRRLTGRHLPVRWCPEPVRARLSDTYAFMRTRRRAVIARFPSGTNLAVTVVYGRLVRFE